MAAANIDVVRRFFDEVWNARRGEMIEEFIDGDSVCHADDAMFRGAEDFRQRQHAPFLAAFPDLRVELDSLVADGEAVVVRWTAVGTHAGEGLGFAPTSQPVTFRGISWITVRNGKFMEGWQSTNIPQVMGQLLAAASA